MRVFITGGTGFFGKSLLARRAQGAFADDEWVILSRDPAAFRAANPAFAQLPGVAWLAGDVRDFAFPEGPFDAILHAATSAVTTISDDEQTSVILDGAQRVAEFAQQCGRPKVLFTSSGAVYGPATVPVDEATPCCPVTAYGKGKLAAERLLLDAGLDVKIARCFAFVGPHLRKDIHFAIGNFMRDCLAGQPILIAGDGTPRRSYLYADDLVDWLDAILRRGETGRPYNVGSDQSVSIRALAEAVRAALGTVNEIVVKGTPVPGAAPSTYVPVVERARTELGLAAMVPLAEAIRLSAAVNVGHG